MFGFNWNIPTPIIKLGCDACELYHDKKKFSGWKCACICHEVQEQKSSSNETKVGLDWDQAEEITKPYGT
jgi:hypothetical protein